MNYRQKRKLRNRVYGNNDRPRLSIFRSNKHIYVQVIDDEKGKTLVSVSDLKMSGKGRTGKNTKLAIQVGKDLAKEMKKKGIDRVVFDRSGYRYHGRIKTLAEELRRSGIDF